MQNQPAADLTPGQSTDSGKTTSSKKLHKLTGHFRPVGGSAVVAGTKPSANFHSTGWKTAAQRVTVLKQVASGYRSLRSFRVYTSVSPTITNLRTIMTHRRTMTRLLKGWHGVLRIQTHSESAFPIQTISTVNGVV